MVKTENFIQVEIKSAADLRQWLEVNHTQKEAVWLILYKKPFGKYYVPKINIIDELLCFGWLDGMARKVDEHKYLLLVSPRRVDHWAESYKKRIAILEAEDRLADAGKAAVAYAKQTGSWHLMDDVDVLAKPEDLIKSLEENPPAMSNFDSFGDSSKRFMLRYIKIAKTEKTREARIFEITRLAKQNEKLRGS